jgi:hypothetical protein
VGELRYGDDRTIHGTKLVNVEVDKKGRVVSVWFRCALVSFDQTVVGDDRAVEMTRAYAKNRPPGLKAVVFDA